VGLQKIYKLRPWARTQGEAGAGPLGGTPGRGTYLSDGVPLDSCANGGLYGGGRPGFGCVGAQGAVIDCFLVLSIVKTCNTVYILQDYSQPARASVTSTMVDIFAHEYLAAL